MDVLLQASLLTVPPGSETRRHSEHDVPLTHMPYETLLLKFWTLRHFPRDVDAKVQKNRLRCTVRPTDWWWRRRRRHRRSGWPTHSRQCRLAWSSGPSWSRCRPGTSRPSGIPACRPGCSPPSQADKSSADSSDLGKNSIWRWTVLRNFQYTCLQKSIYIPQYVYTFKMRLNKISTIK